MLYRTVRILQPDKSWLETDFESLKPGDSFQLREPTGELVSFGDSKEVGTWRVEKCHFDADPVGVDCDRVEINT